MIDDIASHLPFVTKSYASSTVLSLFPPLPCLCFYFVDLVNALRSFMAYFIYMIYGMHHIGRQWQRRMHTVLHRTGLYISFLSFGGWDSMEQRSIGRSVHEYGCISLLYYLIYHHHHEAYYIGIYIPIAFFIFSYLYWRTTHGK
ncbi:hypothetical protein M434DRAFT_371210 [Hypoxylon sp. CO27-5]|nr:hypothetical protein M434DRAFT_371210 [Hypoxylon sp. CO27-5]